LSILQGNSCSIGQKSGGIWTVQTDLQQIYPKSDRLLGRTLDRLINLMYHESDPDRSIFVTQEF
jgi:hypothetical protein